jgi:type I restriction enzyme S subunit
MWRTVKLGDIAELYQPKTITKANMSEDGLYPVYGANGIIGRFNDFNHEEPQLVIGCRGSCGEVHITNGKCWVTGNAMVIKPRSEALLHFLKYFLLQREITNAIITGSAQPQITRKSLAPVRVSLPPLAEQQRIVAKLDAAFAEIDRAIEAAEETKQNLGAIFEKILDASTQHQTSSVKLKDVCNIQAKLISPKDEPYCNEPHIGAGNIVSMSNELVDVLLAKEEGLISGKFPFGTESVLYSKIRPYLRKVHLPSHTGICSADMYPLIPDANALDRKYLYHLLLSQTFTDYAMSGAARAGMPKVNRNHLFDFEFQLPALEVQKLIVKKMEAILFQSSKLQRIHKLKITQIKALKSAILAKELNPSEVA